MEGFDSVGQMLRDSDMVIRAVLAVLVIQSVYIWYAVIKYVLVSRRIAGEVGAMRLALETLDTAGIRAQLQRFGHLLGRTGQPSDAANDADGSNEASLQARVEAAAARADDSLIDDVWGEVYDELTHSCPGLGTIAATAPFIGLFGTVWGILVAFSSVRAAESITFSALAPAIGEALFATLAGLFVAIPAVIANNTLATRAQRLARRFSQAYALMVAEVARLGSRPQRASW